MKTKIALSISILVMLLLLVGCGAVAKQEANNQKLNEEQSPKKEINTSMGNAAMGYEITRNMSENKDSNIEIFYPQISGYAGQLLMDYMNQSLKRIVETYGKGVTYQDVSIDYKITKMDQDIISVLFKGTGKISGGREFNIQQSVNLDSKTSNSDPSFSPIS
jgi:uncharacterized protein YceK